MHIRSIRIEKLFDLFDYNISINNEEGVTIITGPNGYGKTMILNIIDSFFNYKFDFFQTLVFEKIELFLDDETRIVITKEKNNKKNDLQENVFRHNEQFWDWEHISLIEELEGRYGREQHGAKIDFSLFKGKGTAPKDRYSYPNEEISKLKFDLRSGFASGVPKILLSKIFKSNNYFKNIFESFETHLIKEQRLIRKTQEDERSNRNKQDNSWRAVESIREYAKDLINKINNCISEYSEVSQELDSTYLDRLISEKTKITEADYNRRIEELGSKQAKLLSFNLYTGTNMHRDYSEDDAKALLVYLDDLTQKLSVFDNLLAQLEIFTQIINERRFTHKSVKINKEKGFFFETSTQQELSITQLSSGEQHEVVLLYELIFKTRPNELVLIDEPELSLHITWQKEFLNDLFKIVQLGKFQTVVSTHAPAIINGRWDLVYTLGAE